MEYGDKDTTISFISVISVGLYKFLYTYLVKTRQWAFRML